MTSACGVETGRSEWPDRASADPKRALAEARRVARPGAQLFIATWGLPQHCEATAYLNALKSLLPPAPPNAPGPFALSDETALRGFAESVGLTPEFAADVDLPFAYPDLKTALKALLSAGRRSARFTRRGTIGCARPFKPR